jgi:hypothetical protein
MGRSELGTKHTRDQVSQNWVVQSQGWIRHVDEQLVQVLSMPLGGGRTVGPHWGTNVTGTKSFWDPVSLGLNVRVELSLGPKVGGLNIKAPWYMSST